MNKRSDKLTNKKGSFRNSVQNLAIVKKDSIKGVVEGGDRGQNRENQQKKIMICRNHCKNCLIFRG